MRDNEEDKLELPFACSSSKEKQLPTDSGRDFNLLLDTFSRTNCIGNLYFRD